MLLSVGTEMKKFWLSRSIGRTRSVGTTSQPTRSRSGEIFREAVTTIAWSETSIATRLALIDDAVIDLVEISRT